MHDALVEDPAEPAPQIARERPAQLTRSSQPRKERRGRIRGVSSLEDPVRLDPGPSYPLLPGRRLARA